jgi:NAD-dependent DNA ligase
MTKLIKSFLDKASAAYYAGQPFISDEEFDALAEQHNYEELGTHAPNGLKHPYPMWSLQKFYPGDELPKFKDPIRTPKLDGAAICLVYAQGVLVAAHTRGNGKQGQDVLENIMHLVPNTIITLNPVVQINAEVVAPTTLLGLRISITQINLNG